MSNADSSRTLCGLRKALMAELFQVKVPTINEHLKTLYADGEIQPSNH